MSIFQNIISSSWDILKDSSVYILFGIFVSGLLKGFLNPSTVLRHLGRGRFLSVLKAALLGIPIPLCSCGVVPAAASLKRQGANNGATAAFLISTPESGVDSIAISYALLDPALTIARPTAAFITAVAAGVTENTVLSDKKNTQAQTPDLSCPVDGCCDGLDCDPETHKNHHTCGEKLGAGLRFSFKELWPDLAPWFILGIALAGTIDTMIPAGLLNAHLGGGVGSMLIMLALGVPLYICATASTPIAASLILKGVSPGAALVFLLAGPATNAASLSMLLKVLGKRGTAVYLASIAIVSVGLGMTLDWIYGLMGLSAQATVGKATEIIPLWAQISGAIAILALSIEPTIKFVRDKIARIRGGRTSAHCNCSCVDHKTNLVGIDECHGPPESSSCDCTGKPLE